MQPVALTRASILAPIVDFLAQVGTPIERLLEATGVPVSVLTDREALLPTASTARLMNEAARREGIPALGALAGEHADLDRLGLFGRLIHDAPTLRRALRATVRNHPTFSSNGRMWLLARRDDVEFCQAFTSRFDDQWQHASHYVLMLMIGIVRLAAGPDWRPAVVQLQTSECAVLRDVGALSAAHVTFGQPYMSIRIPRALLDLPVRPAPQPIAVADRIVAWQASAPASNLVGSVRQVIEMLSWDGFPDVALTAHVLGMSVRTLQRRLAAVGLTHESLVGRSRIAAAATLLRETDTKILDIALDLGYSDHAHFTRAFRRWIGCAPQEFRRNARAPRRAGVLGAQAQPALVDDDA